MKRKLKNNISAIKYLSVLFVLHLNFFYGQEGIKPLSSNINYFYKDFNLQSNVNPYNGKNKGATVIYDTLPFIEDFYYSTSSQYPSANKWQNDSMVYVNSGFGVAPPSIGVATFDGLNKYGYPYRPSLTSMSLQWGADTLTSVPINLHTSGAQTLEPTSNVGLSFHYQPAGNGDIPEPADSLVLDFYKPKQNAWKNGVWYSRGLSNPNPTTDTNFKRVFVKVTDTACFHEGFKFRFRNWATTSGDFDHWNLDYIILDKNRTDTVSDSLRVDIAITGVPAPFLKNYSAMPYKQYLESEMAAKTSVRIRNNCGNPQNYYYKYRIYNQNGSLEFPEYDGGFTNIDFFNPVLHHGYSTFANHARPPVNDTFALQPTESEFKIEHFVYLTTSTLTAFIKGNDTVTQVLPFRNYYGFDDGSAEAGYYVNGVGAKMAVKINVNTADTLQALGIYFDPAGYVIQQEGYEFIISVWAHSTITGGPSTIMVYNDTIKNKPKFNKTAGGSHFIEYPLRKKTRLDPGTYYVGLQQFQATGTLTIGFDRNYDHRTSVYFDSGNGWQQSAIYGSLMIHPVFGKLTGVGISENIAETRERLFLVYPNPSFDQFTILSREAGKGKYSLINSLGQTVLEGTMEEREYVVNTASLIPGLYFLQLKNSEQQIQQQKIIIRH
jgi:hypothetical protein